MIKQRLSPAEKRQRAKRRKAWRRAKAGLRVALYSEVKKDWMKVYRSGREVLNMDDPAGVREYLSRMDYMLLRQGGLCPECGKELLPWHATFDHEAGRGSGGSRRDDRIQLPDGSWINAAVHAICNSKKGSRRGYKYPAIAKGEGGAEAVSDGA